MRYIAFLAGGLLAATCMAAEPAADQKVGETPDVTPGAAAKEAEKAESPWSIDLAVQLPTAYIFRGYKDVENGVIVQPELTINYKTEIGGVTVTPHVGLWADMADHDNLREVDFIAGATVDLPHKFSLDVIYTFYYSPNNDFEGVSEIGATLSHDDVLQPHIGLFRELDDSLVSDDPSTYLELGIEPEIPWKPTEKLTFTVPVTLGMSLDQYYTDSSGSNSLFGYISGGLHASYELNDHIELTAGVDYVQMLADSTESVNENDEFKVIGAVGMSYHF